MIYKIRKQLKIEFYTSERSPPPEPCFMESSTSQKYIVLVSPRTD